MPGMITNKVWLDSYPDGVPHTINVREYSSIADILASSVEQYGPLPAFSNFGKVISFNDLDRLSASFAVFLQARLGLQKGDRISLMMPNLLQYPVALFGALRAGLIVVNTNPLYTARELSHQLQDSGAKAIVILENFAHTLEKCLEATPVEYIVVTRMGDMLDFPKSTLVNIVVKYVKKMVPRFNLPSMIDFGDTLMAGEPRPVELNADDVAFLQYTGGTTGVAKGAMLTHGNMVANVLQSSAWLDPFVADGKEVVVTALPLYHIFALTANCMTFMKKGGLNVLITNPRDMKGFVAELRKIRFTTITGVNTLFNSLMNSDGFSDLDFSSLHITLGGGMAVQRSVAERWKKTTGVTLVEAYGLTETSPAACINPLNLKEFNASIGLPIPNTECAIFDDDGNELGQGEIGELCVRGPQVMKGYWQRPAETANCLSGQGWLRTGDIAWMDEAGFFTLVDRKKDMILVSGFNVYPSEIEEVISSHPDVLEVGAIGVPDENSGEVVKVVVVKRNPGLTEEILQAFCRENLTGYKCPKIISFVKELPKSNVGKILRRELRDGGGA